MRNQCAKELEPPILDLSPGSIPPAGIGRWQNIKVRCFWYRQQSKTTNSLYGVTFLVTNKVLITYFSYLVRLQKDGFCCMYRF